MAVLYGAGAWTGTYPVGGLTGGTPGGTPDYTSAYAEGTSDYVVETLAELSAALDSHTSSDAIWVKAGSEIVVPAAYGKTVKGVLASNRGASGAAGGKIKWTQSLSTSGYMIPLLQAASGSIFSGVQLQGPGGYGPYGQDAGHCGIRGVSGAVHVEVENCHIYNFRGGGVYFQGGYSSAPAWAWNNDTYRHLIHHCHIHNVQQYGFGYGLGVEGAYLSMLIEASIVEHCRHNIMTAGNSTSSYEVRYSLIGESDYANNWTGPATIQAHQIDAHGGGYYGFRAGNHLYVHHNTFTANNSISSKQNVSIRGVVNSEGRFEYNWTQKTTYTGAHVDANSGANNLLIQLNAEEGGTWDGPGGYTALLTEANVYTNYGSATGNWYGTANPDEDTTPVVQTKAATSVASTTATLNGQVLSLGGEADVDVSFQYGLTTAYGSTTTPETVGLGSFDAAITSLDAATTYHFRAKIVGASTAYGSDFEFTTEPATPVAPTCTTEAATAITSSTATLNASVTGLSSSQVCVKRGFKWDTDTGSPYTYEWYEEGEWTADMDFSHNAGDLDKETKYYFTAYIEMR